MQLLFTLAAWPPHQSKQVGWLLSIDLLTYLPTHQQFYLASILYLTSIYLSCLFVCLFSILMSIIYLYLSIYLMSITIHLSIFMSINLSTYHLSRLSLYPCIICLSIYHLYVYLSMYPSLSVYPFIHQSASGRSIHLSIIYLPIIYACILLLVRLSIHLSVIIMFIYPCSHIWLSIH